MKQMKWTFLAGTCALLLWGLMVGLRSDPDSQKADKEPTENEKVASSAGAARLPAQANSSSPAPVVPPQTLTPSIAPAMAKTALPHELEELRRLNQCLQTEDCDYPKTDPKSYPLAVGQDMKSTLKSLATTISRDPAYAQEAERVARELMLNPDGHVQEGALALFSQLPPSPENLNSILEGLRGNAADPLILEQASSELVRYMNGPAENMVHQYLGETLSAGALFTSQKAGIVVKDVLTPESVHHYREVLRDLDPQSTTARNLRTTLDEYDRLRSGG